MNASCQISTQSSCMPVSLTVHLQPQTSSQRVTRTERKMERGEKIEDVGRKKDKWKECERLSGQLVATSTGRFATTSEKGETPMNWPFVTLGSVCPV